MAILTEVEPLTPRCAMYATPNENTIATTIMKANPGLVALMKVGQSVPTRYPEITPITPTITPG